MKNLMVLVMLFASIQSYAQLSPTLQPGNFYMGVRDANFKGAILFTETGFRGNSRVLTAIGDRAANFTAKSVQVYGGYKVTASILGKKVSLHRDEEEINLPRTTYELRKGTKLFSAILYSGPNQTGKAWFIAPIVDTGFNTDGWYNHFPGNDYPKSVKVLGRASVRTLNGDPQWICTGVHNFAAGIVAIRPTRQECQ